LPAGCPAIAGREEIGSPRPPAGIATQNSNSRHETTANTAVALGVPKPTKDWMRMPSMTPRPPGLIGWVPTRLAIPYATSRVTGFMR
jgi:hypothetical protein